MYRKIDAATLARLAEIVGKGNLLTAPDLLEPYSHDEVAELAHTPEAVARVTSAAQVAAIMKLAARERFPVTPRGAGQGLSGGAVPVHGGLVLSLEKMNRILEIDEQNLIATCEPGVITGELHREVEARGLFYPPDPASLDSCTIGGNVAENAGGPRAIKYGVTRDYICGLEAVLPAGDIIRLGGKVVKNVTGYDLLQLLSGSEGTLAVIVKILVRLLPLPPERIDLLVPFNDFRQAAESVAEIIHSRIVPAALEFMERDSLLAVEKLLEREVPFREAQAHLLITLDGMDRSRIEADYEKIGEICVNHEALDVLVADNQPTRDRLWETRRMIIEALQNLSPQHVMSTQDVVVPRSELPALLEKIRAIGGKYGLNIISFGHSGDGNVHVNIIKDVPEQVWRSREPAAEEEIYRSAVELGGAVTGEHGIGLTRRRYLSLNLDELQIGLMERIKHDFDPLEILNPGKIFP
jgi:glycolate oxidase